MVSDHYDGVRDRLSALENAMSIVMDAVADIAATPAAPAAPCGAAVQVFDPHLIADPGARRGAWEKGEKSGGARSFQKKKRDPKKKKKNLTLHERPIPL